MTRRRRGRDLLASFWTAAGVALLVSQPVVSDPGPSTPEVPTPSEIHRAAEIAIQQGDRATAQQWITRHGLELEEKPLTLLLHLALEHGDLETADLLIGLGASVDEDRLQKQFIRQSDPEVMRFFVTQCGTDQKLSDPKVWLRWVVRARRQTSAENEEKASNLEEMILELYARLEPYRSLEEWRNALEAERALAFLAAEQFERFEGKTEKPGPWWEIDVDAPGTMLAAVGSRSSWTVELLLTAGADPDVCGAEGARICPLELAARIQSTELTQLLLDGGATQETTNAGEPIGRFAAEKLRLEDFLISLHLQSEDQVLVEGGSRVTHRPRPALSLLTKLPFESAHPRDRSSQPCQVAQDPWSVECQNEHLMVRMRIEVDSYDRWRMSLQKLLELDEPEKPPRIEVELPVEPSRGGFRIETTEGYLRVTLEVETSRVFGQEGAKALALRIEETFQGSILTEADLEQSRSWLALFLFGLLLLIGLLLAVIGRFTHAEQPPAVE